MNPENLTPFNLMDPERHRELSRKGGRASGAARRRRARKRRILAFLLSVEPSAEREGTPRPPARKKRV